MRKITQLKSDFTEHIQLVGKNILTVTLCYYYTYKTC